MQTASLSTLIDALRAHLIPKPLLNALPTALQIFAHFQSVGERIKLEAARALREHYEMLRLMDRRAVNPQDQVTLGALDEQETRRLIELAKRDEKETMFALSMDFRKHHIAILLSTTGVTPAIALNLIDQYFPDLPFDDPKVQRHHRMLYIRAMQPSQWSKMRMYRDVALAWYKTARALHRSGNRCPKLQDFVGIARDSTLSVLSRKLFEEADMVIQHANELEAMFPPTEERGSPPQIADVIPIFDYPSFKWLIKSSCKTSAATTRQDNTNTPSRYHKPPSSSARSDASSSSPSPKRIARLPRVSFDMSKGKARIVVEKRTPKPGPSIASRQSPMSAELDGTNDQWSEFPLALPNPRLTPTTNLPVVMRAAKPDSPVEHLIKPRPSTPAILNSIKRGRTSSGLTPRTGPDYTAPSPSFGSNVEKSDLKPFDNSRLKRSGDQNSPRGKKKARSERAEGLEDDGHQENGLCSVLGLDVGSRNEKKNKGKAREAFTPQDIFT
ncbi:MAG: hypothetical protein TREMPRED_003955 [Tremellales sp. Tagirdzhanova-0007]|nr:MAG: hypothetical protein TREMPRED_003955 [Tremellales sp. Tagirdzhanova-0007]